MTTRPGVLWTSWIALIAGWWAACGGAGAEVSGNLEVEGLPEPDPALRIEVAPYLEFRANHFQDWHPRRRDVLITTRSGDTLQLHQIGLPEGPRRQLTFTGEPVAGGWFQPGTGDLVVFQQDAGGGEFHQLYRLDMSDGGVTRLTDGKSRNTGPRWSPGGRWIAYGSTRRNGRDVDLYVMDPADPATDRRVAELPGGGWEVMAWSPDEKRLLLGCWISANESELHEVTVATGGRRRLTPEEAGPVSYGGGRYLGGGRSVLVTTDRGSEFRHLARLDPESGALEPVGPRYAGDVEDFDVSPDGRRVALFVNAEGISRLHLLDLATGRERRVPELPAGVATGLRWRPGGREIGFALSSAKLPGEVLSVDVRTGGVTRWTIRETGGVPARRLADPEQVRIRSFDGLGLSGFLYRPDAKRFPGPRPVLISIHGGPEGQARPVFQGRWNHLLAELGVAVLHPNVRGSSGFGRTFLSLDNGRLREDAVKDIGSFLDWIATQPGLDAAKVAVHGGSYGGYMVLASLVHHGDRLRLGIDVVGISRFPSFLRSTQDYRRDLRRVEYGDERDPAMAGFLERISPLTQVDRIRRPLLVAQGLNDPRVPVTESEQLVEAVRGRGGEVAYLLARDEGHGFAKKRNADFLFLSMVQFLKQHLCVGSTD